MKQGAYHVTLKLHEFARSKDPVLLDFLGGVRTTQPTRSQLRRFFGTRAFGGNLEVAVLTARKPFLK